MDNVNIEAEITQINIILHYESKFKYTIINLINIKQNIQGKNWASIGNRSAAVQQAGIRVYLVIE